MSYFAKMSWSHDLSALSLHVNTLCPGCTAKNAEVARRLLTSSNRLVINKPISECVRMACDSLLTTSVIVKTCYPLASLLQVVSTSCNKSANDKLQQA